MGKITPLLLAAICVGASSAAPDVHWPQYGGEPTEARYSPLAQINTGNIGRLGLVWATDLDTTSAASQPIEVDGVIYTATGYSVVHAVDAETGKVLWRFDPEVPAKSGTNLRMGWGVRGLTYSDGKLFLGSNEGRLYALDAKTGKVAWSTLTVDNSDGAGRYITGAPRVFRGKVLIGFGGADYGAVRGYVTAYDVKTGKQAWRFYTVPGDPAKGFEDETQAMAAKTWTGRWWEVGGGGTAWNSMTFDEKYNRVYIGTGNGFPWNPRIRSPQGGDNLFLASVVALDADTGKYVWHYQQNPSESWDWSSAMDIVLGEIDVQGVKRDVLMNAPKNGFFYVIDRRTGKLVSAEKFAKATWASRIDIATGRPVEEANIRYENGPALISPGLNGAHNWYPMSFSPQTGFAYLPTVDGASTHSDTTIDKANFKPNRLMLNNGTDLVDRSAGPPTNSYLQAWDPAKQRQVWKVDTPAATNGGAMTTAGGLVFQGWVDGTLNAFDARTGAKVWSFDARGVVFASAITYSRKGKQYLTVLAGPPAGSAGGGPGPARYGWDYRIHPRRLLTFAIGGQAKLPETPPAQRPALITDAPPTVDPAIATAGSNLYRTRCMTCHGLNAIAGGGAPDLRASPVVGSSEAFSAIVRDGALRPVGMPNWAEMTDQELEALRHFIRRQAQAQPPAATAAIPAASH